MYVGTRTCTCAAKTRGCIIVRTEDDDDAFVKFYDFSKGFLELMKPKNEDIMKQSDCNEIVDWTREYFEIQVCDTVKEEKGRIHDNLKSLGILLSNACLC